MTEKERALSKLDELDKLKNETEAECRRLSDEELRFRPDPNSWSVLQVIEHLVLVERMTLVSIKKGEQRVQRQKNRNLATKVRSLVLKAALLLPFKYTAPAVVEVKDEPESPDQLFDSWDEARKALRAWIAGASEELMQKELFRHPIAGMMTPLQAVEFIKAHLIHHRKQLLKLIRQAGGKDTG
jgi:uncharacterized damage-inducible protein DinB